MTSIPQTLAPFFQEYSLAQLDPDRDSATIIERTLRYGSRAELHWLFRVYSRVQITEWVVEWGRFGLPEPHFSFWNLFLEKPRIIPPPSGGGYRRDGRSPYSSEQRCTN
jgi:hypothetical protein